MYLKLLQARSAAILTHCAPSGLARGIHARFRAWDHAILINVPFPTYPKNLPGDEFTTQQNHPVGAWVRLDGQSVKKRWFFGVCPKTYELMRQRMRQRPISLAWRANGWFRMDFL